MSVRGWVAWAGAAAVLVGAPAQSAGLAVVAVDGCEAGATANAAQLVRAGLARRSNAMVSAEEMALRLGGAPRGSLADAERMLASARFDFFDQSAYDRAERTLRAVLEDLRALPPSQARWEDLRDGQTLLAFLYVRQNNNDAAEATLNALLAVDPKLEPSVDLYPPSFRAMVDELRKRVARRPSGTLRVTTTPSGVPVYVEGRGIGPSPATVKLPQGRYHVEADFKTGGNMPRQVDVTETGSAELSQDFEGRIFAGLGPCVSTGGTREGRLSLLSRLAAVLDVDELVAVRAEEPTSGERFIVATTLDAHSGQELREGKVKVRAGAADPASMQRLADFLSTGAAQPPVVVTTGGITVPPGASGLGGEVTKSGPGSPALRTTSYVVGGVGLASLAGAGYFLGQASATGDAIEKLKTIGPNGDPVYPAEASPLFTQQSNQQTTAYVLAGVGVASLATSVVLFIVSGGDDAAPAATAGVSVHPTANGVLVVF